MSPIAKQKIVEEMIGLYCKKYHAPVDGALCPQCQSLLDYAKHRIEGCPLGNTRPFCSKCPVGCYKPDRKAEIRKVMRFSGPRMLFHHPLILLRHLLKK